MVRQKLAGKNRDGHPQRMAYFVYKRKIAVKVQHLHASVTMRPYVMSSLGLVTAKNRLLHIPANE